MRANPNEMSDRPALPELRADVLSDVLEGLRLSTLFHGRFELGGTWATRVPAKPTSSFYLLARGRLRITLDGPADPLFPAVGDIVLIPRGARHTLDDGSRRTAPTRGFMSLEPTAPGERAGEGGTTTLLAGCFGFAAGIDHPLLRALPPVVHLRADDPRYGPRLAATARLVTLESATRDAGQGLVLARLADVLLVQALRACAPDELGFRALADPSVSTALSLIHVRWDEPWTVEQLASAVGRSRSGFAARFRELVGEPPLRYLVHWRLTKAAHWLLDGDDGIDQIAERAGYETAAAFGKAFKRWAGVAPGTYRRTAGRG